MRRIIIDSMWQSSSKYLCLALVWLAANPTASVASSPLAKDAESSTAPLCIAAAGGDFPSVACHEQTSSLPTLKQEAGKTLLKAAANGPHPRRLSRLRALSAISGCGAFLPPDTLQTQDVRLQI
jgi:hypothetical protein